VKCVCVYGVEEKGADGTRGFMSGTAQPPNIPEDVIRDVYATNVLGVINMTQAILPIMKRRGKGDVVFLGSIAGREAYVGGTVSEKDDCCCVEVADRDRFIARVKRRFELLVMH
jgi:NAD(P)-dependent dehydrogenase (short-subunit alcohol dehydrogenase family)